MADGMKRIRMPSQIAVARAMNTLVEGYYWPTSLEPQSGYTRRHDDTDGKRGIEEDLTVSIGPDGDMWVVVAGAAPLRFRSDAGGGQSLRVRNALLVLAEAIRRDNNERPQGGRGHEDAIQR
jgi:hypothetical protein